MEPFVGGAALFFALRPRISRLVDINPELIDLYRGIRYRPRQVWKIFSTFPRTKTGYYEIREWDTRCAPLFVRAARTLFLNRTCFKGMWRHNARGKFNVGYGGQDRRWAITEQDLIDVSKLLKRARLECGDFAETIDACVKGDFIFSDPPYRPGERAIEGKHYASGGFEFGEQERLAVTLKRASNRGVCWALTNSRHPDITSLYAGFQLISLPKGAGNRPGILSRKSAEVLILNYGEEYQWNSFSRKRRRRTIL